jgi:hypothetical protein
MTTIPDAADLLRPVTCPACGHHVAVTLFGGEAEPLESLTRPGRATPTRAVSRRALDVIRCVDCGHVFNAASDHAAVPHADQRSRTFNGAPGWPEHVRAVRDEMLARLPGNPVVVEVGHGDGRFLTVLAEARPTGRYVGFDPHGVATAGHPAVELRRDWFVATRELANLGPHLIVSRYMMEYLTHPLGFIQELAFAAARSGIQPVLYLEVPCIDRALETGRTFDFDHEHTSYFTTTSFMRMLSRCGVVEQRIGHGYQKEVVYAFVRFGRGQAQVEHARAAEAFRNTAHESLAHLHRQLDALAASGRSLAIWGGTGEAAAFIAQSGMDADRFPIVIDSDADAIGTFVPGTGQEIRSPEWLRAHRVDVVIIPAQRRARDVVREMAASDIRCDRVLVELRGRLVAYVADAPPYRDTGVLAVASG